jgi:hypothetical protein
MTSVLLSGTCRRTKATTNYNKNESKEEKKERGGGRDNEVE